MMERISTIASFAFYILLIIFSLWFLYDLYFAEIIMETVAKDESRSRISRS